MKNKGYWCVSNIGEVDMKAFRIMGMSSKDGNDKIGQFGTGTKYGISAILRANLQLHISTQSQKISFLKKDVMFRDQTHEQVIIKDGTKRIETSMTVEMGSKHWGIKEGLREFVSNAIDEGGFEYFKTNAIGKTQGRTHVYIERSKEVDEYFESLDMNFLLDRTPVFKGKEVNIYEATDPNVAHIYRRGVSVFSVNRKCKYYYEFNDISLPESRIASSWDVRCALGSALFEMPVDIRAEVMCILNDNDFIESDMYYGYATINNSDPVWGKILKGRIVVTPDESAFYRDHLFGHSIYVLPSDLVEKLRKHIDLKFIKDVVKSSTLKGWEESVPVTRYETNLLIDAVNFLVNAGYKISVDDIVVANNDSEDASMGQFIDDKLYINFAVFRLGFDEVLDTIAHELFHKISKASDESRAFEAYLIKECLYHMKKLNVLKKMEG